MLLDTTSRGLLCFNSLLLRRTGGKNLLMASTNNWLLFLLPLLLSKNYCRLSPQCRALLLCQINLWMPVKHLLPKAKPPLKAATSATLRPAPRVPCTLGAESSAGPSCQASPLSRGLSSPGLLCSVASLLRCHGAPGMGARITPSDSVSPLSYPGGNAHGPRAAPDPPSATPN